MFVIGIRTGFTDDFVKNESKNRDFVETNAIMHVIDSLFDRVLIKSCSLSGAIRNWLIC